MVNSIKLINFKCFNDTKNIELKPLTILCGTNSSGKSSVIQSILMLKQTFESQSQYNNVVLNGQYVHLGSFKNIVYNKNLDNEIQLGFEINIKDVIRVTSYKDKFPPMQLILRDIVFPNSTSWKSKFLDIKIGLKSSEISENLSPYINSFTVTAKSLSSNEFIEGTVIDFKHIEDNIYRVKWKEIKLPHFINEINIPIPKDTKEYFCPKCNHNHKTTSKEGINHYKLSYFHNHQESSGVSFINLIPEIEIISGDEKSLHQFHHINRPLIYLKYLFQAVFSNIFYIGPLREEPSRRYFLEADYFDIGTRGENAPFILSIEGSNKIKPYYFMDHDAEKWTHIKDDTLSSGVRKWLKYMGISDDYSLEPNEEIIRLYLKAHAGVNVTLADVGFGVSQILPILVEGLRINPGQTLILEQPEIHLHPKLQMELADFFVSMALSGKKVLIETHSDHIINRIVRRIIEDDTQNLLSKTNILFFGQGEKDPIDHIKIDSDKGIINWPKGFFDQASEEIKLIIQKGIEKRQNKRRNSL